MPDRPTNVHLYWRVIHRERARDAETDALELSGLVEQFARERPHVRLLAPPCAHPRGGFSLHLDLRDDDKAACVEFLYHRGWAGVV